MVRQRSREPRNKFQASIDIATTINDCTMTWQRVDRSEAEDVNACLCL